MGHGKEKNNRIKKKKVWKILDGTYKKPIGKEDVERLIAAVQQECYWDDRDVETWDEINSGKIDWSGDVRSKRKPRKHIRKRS
jgi:hypothetical protein|tara:strand:- start:228 stop:476 length:249 start_codon:yes stop_codon:yes gene_type:complete